MTIKCVIFDADGVVINFEYFTVELERKYGISHKNVQPFFKDKFYNCLVGKSDLKTEIKPYLKNWGWKKSVNAFLEFWFKTEDRPNKNLIDYIKKIHAKKVVTVLATNQEKYRTRFMANEMNFKNVFHMIISSADAKSKKPHKKFFSFIYKQLKQKYGFKKEEIVFWDDNDKNVSAANKFGFQSFQYLKFSMFRNIMRSLLN